MARKARWSTKKETHYWWAQCCLAHAELLATSDKRLFLARYSQPPGRGTQACSIRNTLLCTLFLMRKNWLQADNAIQRLKGQHRPRTAARTADFPASTLRGWETRLELSTGTPFGRAEAGDCPDTMREQHRCAATASTTGESGCITRSDIWRASNSAQHPLISGW